MFQLSLTQHWDQLNMSGLLQFSLTLTEYGVVYLMLVKFRLDIWSGLVQFSSTQTEYRLVYLTQTQYMEWSA